MTIGRSTKRKTSRWKINVAVILGLRIMKQMLYTDVHKKQNLWKHWALL